MDPRMLWVVAETWDRHSGGTRTSSDPSSGSFQSLGASLHEVPEHWVLLLGSRVCWGFQPWDQTGEWARYPLPKQLSLALESSSGTYKPVSCEKPVGGF